MRILVTGHRGYIGARLVPLFEAAGHDVIGLDSDLYRSCRFGSGPVPSPGLVKDVRDVTPADLEGFDAVIHLAGLSNDPLGDLDPSLTHELNMRATVRLARLARDAGVRRFLFSSSCSNYGAAGEDWLTETSPLNPVTPYAVSKVKSEEELDKLADENFSPVYLRSSTAYGVSSKIRFDLVVNNLTAWAIATGKVFLKSNGMAWRPVVHIEDISRAFLAALDADRSLVHREAFNVGRTEDNYQIRDIAEFVHGAVAGSEIAFSDERSVDERTYMVDCSKIRGLGFEPKWDVRSGIDELVSTFSSVGVSQSDFEGPRYQRVAHIRHLIETGEVDSSLRRTEVAAL